MRSLRSPVALSFQFSDVAIRRLAIRPPFWKPAVLEALDLGIGAEIADQHDLVETACHRIVSSCVRHGLAEGRRPRQLDR